ncbi:MAG: phosphodiester glycosidase family protein [bacterium]
MNNVNLSCPVILSGGATKTNIYYNHDIPENKEVFPGITYSCIGTKSPILFFEIDPNRADIDLIAEKLPPNEYKEAYKPLLMTNGGYFERDYSPAGLVMLKGKVLSPLKEKLSAVLLKKDNNYRIDFLKNVSPEEMAKADLVLQAGPLLIEPGRKKGIRSANDRSKEAIASRTAIGLTKQGKILLISSPKPIRLFDLMNLVLKHNKDIDVLMNLDGGPSTMLSFDCPKCTPPINLKYTPHPNLGFYPNVIVVNPIK